MNILPIEEAYKKLVRVVRSCENTNHLKVADKYRDNFKKLYDVSIMNNDNYYCKINNLIRYQLEYIERNNNMKGITE